MRQFVFTLQLNQNDCHNVHIFQFILVSVQRITQTRFRIFLQTRMVVDGANFSSHYSGSHFKNRLLKMNTVRKLHISLKLS